MRYVLRLSFRGLRVRGTPLQIPPRPISDLAHRALRFGEEGKDRVNMDRILYQTQRHVDTGTLRAFGQAHGVAEQHLTLSCRDEKRRQAGEIAEQRRHQRIRRLVALEIRCPHEGQEVAVRGGIVSIERTDALTR